MMKASVERASEPTAGMGFERRKSERTQLVVRVDYQTVDDLFSEFARNINEGGLFVETDHPPAPGTAVSLQFKIPGSDEPIQVQGRVAHTTSDTGDQPLGMGIEFDDLDAQARERINELVRELRAGASRRRA